MKQQGHAAEYANNDEADPHHVFHLAMAQPGPGDLDEGRRNRHAGCKINIAQLESSEKEEDRKKVEKKFHDQTG